MARALLEERRGATRAASIPGGSWCSVRRMSTLPLFGPSGRGGGPDERVYRVGQLNRLVRLTLEEKFAEVWVQGELSDVSHAGSGHVYFTLNDERESAQVRCVMFRSDARRAKAKLQDGARVRLRGTLSLFEPRGSYQLIARIALPDGLGDLHAQFEAVRKKLAAEGLLAPERKRKLPKLPRVLGVVTSEHGAALHDIVRVARGRCPVRIVVAPCLVQGAVAARSIEVALRDIQKLPELDVVIVGRGGGSAEDLFAFNEERVARAIAGCRVPVVSAVGHEVDVTIADLVADVRAATPSNAAELCVPDQRALTAELASHERALARAMEVRIGRGRLRLDRGRRRLRDPRALLRDHRAELAAARAKLSAAAHGRLRAERRALALLLERVGRRDPRLACAHDRARLHDLRARLRANGLALAARRRAQLSQQAARLHALSPLAVLARGYAIALHERSGRALLRASDAGAGDALHLRLFEGELRVRVEPAK
jgi:exodeoxyribonuclease VII large subunit